MAINSEFYIFKLMKISITSVRQRGVRWGYTPPLEKNFNKISKGGPRLNLPPPLDF
jgi:hypothetical protein